METCTSESSGTIKKTEVSHQIDNINNSLLSLSDRISELTKRLQRLLIPEKENPPEANTVKSSPICEHAKQLQSIDEDILSQSGYIKSIIDRLEF
jgi:hypothetical protein